jgi:predicted outer membrane repeat protein
LHLEAGAASPFTNPVVVENNYFIHNDAAKGGAFSTINVPVKMQNNVFSGNHASQWGGAAYLWKEPTSNLDHLVTIVNNSFYGNTARNEGGAIYSLNCKPLIFNTIFYKDSTHNHPQEIFAHSSIDTVEIAFSNIDQGLIHVYDDENLITEEGNINEDPLFIDPETLHPAVWSPCVDAGTSQYIHMGSLQPAPSFDILGTARPAGVAFDIGAYDDVSGGLGIREIAYEELNMMNWPNPFTGSTTISYTLPEAAKVVIRIFDSFGRLVDEPQFVTQQAGAQKVCWNAATLPAGLYFCRIEAGGQVGGLKMVKK